MSQNESSKKLDQLLNQWSERNAPTEDQITSLADRIKNELHHPTVVLPKVVLPSETHRGLPLWMGILGTAAAIVLMMSAWRVATSTPKGSIALTPNPPVAQGPSDSSSGNKSGSSLPGPKVASGQNKSVLFQEMQRVFNHQLAWIAETKEDVLFEIDSEPSAGHGPLMCIRLVLADNSSTSTSSNNPNIWELDVIVRSEQMVHIASAGTTPDLMLWPYLTDDGQVLVETQINLPAPFGQQLIQTKLLSPDTEAVPGEIENHFVLTQSVVLLKEPSI